MGGYPGGDTVGVVTKVASGQTDSMGQPITVDQVVWVYGCVFEGGMDFSSLGVIMEKQSDTFTASEQAWVFMPYVSGLGIPAIDAAGNPTTATITNGSWIRPKRPDAAQQRDYKVLGLPDVNYDFDGQPDHVFVACEWRAG